MSNLLPLDDAERGAPSARQPMMATDNQSNTSQPSQSRIYPIRLCCCPCLPSSLTVIQDWLHLTLLVGVLVSIAVIVQMIVTLSTGPNCKSFACFTRWIAAVCIVPSMIYFITTIGSYNEDLRSKKKEKEEAVEQLISHINELVEELNVTRQKVTASANDFASGYFNEKTLEFAKYLKVLKQRNADFYRDDEATAQLRIFILQWFNTFSQTLINPDANPLVMGLEKDLNSALTIEALCDKGLERLDRVKIGFATQTSGSHPLLPSGSSRTVQDLERSEGKCGITWFRCRRVGCQIVRTRDPSGNTRLPVTMNMGCFMLRILSNTHGNLMLAFIVDIFLTIFEICNERWWSTALVIINAICVAALLACIEQINEIQVLEQQINQYQQRDANIKTESDKARDEWGQVQQLHDLWNYRTVPSLSILGKVHAHLADIDNGIEELPEGESRGVFLCAANQHYSAMEIKLGEAREWATSGPLDEEWKKSIGKQIKDLQQRTDVNEIIRQLPLVTKDLRMLDAPPPSASPLSSPCSSRSSSFVADEPRGATGARLNRAPSN